MRCISVVFPLPAMPSTITATGGEAVGFPDDSAELATSLAGGAFSLLLGVASDAMFLRVGAWVVGKERVVICTRCSRKSVYNFVQVCIPSPRSSVYERVRVERDSHRNETELLELVP